MADIILDGEKQKQELQMTEGFADYIAEEFSENAITVKATYKGGKGSGHFGHAGRPGKIGGSAARKLTLPDETLIEYLEKVASITHATYATETLVSKYGKVYKPQALPTGYKHGKIKECYANATNLAWNDPDLTYVEGYALTAYDFPIHHAWVVDKEGNVIDNTWPTPGISYIGIPFNTDFINKVMAENEVYGVLGYGSYKFFKDGMPDDAIRYKGGPGSGHHGHSGRPGKIGGSAPGTHIAVEIGPEGIPYINAAETKYEDLVSYDKVMHLQTPEARKAADKLGISYEQAILMMREAREFQATHEQTMNQYMDASGNIDSDRLALYQQYIDSLFQGDIYPAEGEAPNFFMTGGLPGSGKSHMMRQEMFADTVEHSVTVNADEVREYLARADGLSNVGKYSALYTDEADYVVEMLFERAVDERANIILDATLKSGGKIKRYIDTFENFGYTTEIAYAKLPLEKSMDRAVARFLRGDRFVDPAYILSSDGKNWNSVQWLKNEVNRATIWDVDVPYGDNAKLIEEVTE